MGVPREFGPHRAGKTDISVRGRILGEDFRLTVRPHFLSGVARTSSKPNRKSMVTFRGLGTCQRRTGLLQAPEISAGSPRPRHTITHRPPRNSRTPKPPPTIGSGLRPTRERQQGWVTCPGGGAAQRAHSTGQEGSPSANGSRCAAHLSLGAPRSAQPGRLRQSHGRAARRSQVPGARGSETWILATWVWDAEPIVRGGAGSETGGGDSDAGVSGDDPVSPPTAAGTIPRRPASSMTSSNSEAV